MSVITQTEFEQGIDEQVNGVPAINGGWDDLANSLIGRRLTSNAGTVDYDWENNAISFSPNGDINDVNDCVVWNLQKPHSAKDDSTANQHFHWEQTSASDLEFTMWYRIQDNGQAKTTAWTEVVVGTNANNVFPYTSGTENQITKLVDIDWSAVGISATVQFRMTRSDAVAGAVLVTFVDAHVERDQERGSRQEFVK